MRRKLTARVGVLAMGAALLAGTAAQAQEHVRLMPQLGMGLINSVAYSPDGRYVLTGGDNAARLWDAATGQLLRVFAGHALPVNSVAFSPDGRSGHERSGYVGCGGSHVQDLA